MAAATEIYRERVLSNFNGLCLLLGLRVDGSADNTLYDFLVDSKSSFRNYYNQDDLIEASLKIEASVAEISKISESCSFSYVSLLDFTMYERIDYLLNLVLAYQDVNCITAYMDSEAKEFIEYISLLEKDNGPQFKNTLSYMAIRNFLMFLVNKKFLHASCYATFIKEQIFLSENLSPKLKFSDVHKDELSLSIRKERARYSNRIRSKLKKSTKSIINNTFSHKNDDGYKDHEDKIIKGKRKGFKEDESEDDIRNKSDENPKADVRDSNKSKDSNDLGENNSGDSVSPNCNISSNLKANSRNSKSGKIKIKSNNLGKSNVIQKESIPQEPKIHRVIKPSKLNGAYKSSSGDSNTKTDKNSFHKSKSF